MRPSRELFRQADQTYFATFQTARRQCFFRNERWRTLFLATLERYLPQLGLHDFVIMPDHIHLLLSPQVPLERAVQFIKGGFSFQARRELQWKGDLWQAGFSDHRVRNIVDWDNHCEYMRKNAASAQSEGRAIRGKDSGLALHPLPQWLKPLSSTAHNGGAEAPPLQSSTLTRETQVLPLHSSALDREIEALPHQSSTYTRVPETAPLHNSPPPMEGRTDIHSAKDAEDLFRKLSI